MTKNMLPKLLQDAINENSIDVKILTEQLKLPWLHLNIKFPKLSTEYVNQLEDGKDWRDQWKFKAAANNSYQVKGWNGDFLFGPKPFDTFIDHVNSLSDFEKIDEDSRAKQFRNKFKFDWYVNEDDIIRQWINTILPDNDINIVNTYFLPPGGYVFPHRDYSKDNMGLAKIYIAAQWPEEAVFGMYGCGNIPIKQGDVLLLNNYTLPHWVYNGGNEKRLVIDIGANLQSPTIQNLIKDAFKKTFNQ
jgi:hypothetical protein